ncbi:hypothetical protein CRM22_005254 [Opisthorchis felineus]|uniref:D-isomer specific 2-hydroxyacid dehydrogenase NAD-binding domain-containing protein n=1 Tax=Opisthorchis felineus TaxID=147828 RepID=A0A4S2LS22_OPIFE|nr:hypothetical protein CRM22_005254 [Opisthorchis felineus]
MGKRTNVTGLESKRLLRPLEAYVLLPDRLCNVRSDEALSPFTPCMVDLITTALTCCGTLGDTALVPVSWMKLKLDPDKMVSVVAAVIPSLNGQPCYHILKKSGADRRPNKRDLYIFETISCVSEWECEKLFNLQVVIILPWPDPSIDVFDKSSCSLPTAHKTKKAILEGGPVTVGGHPSLYQKYYFDLNQVCAWNYQVLCVSDWFAQSTAELAIALLACLNSGILKEANSVYHSWMQSLVNQQPTFYGASNHRHKHPSSITLRSTQPGAVVRGQHLYRSKVVVQLRQRSSRKRMWQRADGMQRRAQPTPSGLTHVQYLSRAKVLIGSRLGLVGLVGELPRIVAKIAEQGLGMKIFYYQPHPESDLPYRHVSNLLELLEFSDVIVLADDTLNYVIRQKTLIQAMAGRTPVRRIGKPEVWLTHNHFARIQSHALLVCVTQIQCIDFAALTAALRYGNIRGAAITTPTVWTTQLTELDELRNLPNTFVLPPSTSSACAPREIRLNLAHHVVELIAESLYDDIGKQTKDVSQDPRPLVKIRKIPVPSLTLISNLSNSRNESGIGKYAQTLLRVVQKLPLNQLGAVLHKHWKSIADEVKMH